MSYPPWTSPSPAPVFDRGGQLRARASSADTCLPQSLLSAVPSCAVVCIQEFATSKYTGSTCADTSNLDYLCTQDNTSGLTIGEGSLQCVVSFCTGQDQTELGVYNICQGVPSAQPQTARTITATIIGTSTSTSVKMNTFPPTIISPTSTQLISTIVMTTYPSPLVTATSPSPAAPPMTIATSESGMSASTQGASAGLVMPNQSTSKGSLSTPQVAGIAIAGGATALIFVALLTFFFCFRKRRREKRRGQRRSRIVDPSPPPDYQSPQKEASPTFTNVYSTPAVPNTIGRFYAPRQPAEERRRSFWRKSIKPDEIGVAISPRLPGPSSPTVSISSQQSISRLLPAGPSRALWPAPLDLEATRERKRHTQRLSDTAVFEDESVKDLESQPIYIDSQPFILEKPPAARRQRGAPPPLRLPAVPENPTKAASGAARIPLTPTYDNGNVSVVSPPRSFGSQASTDETRVEATQLGEQSLTPVAEHNLAPSSAYANRNVLRKKPPVRLPLRVVNSPPAEPLEQPRNAPTPPMAGTAPRIGRRDSITSVSTEIEEDTTPEEVNKQLGLRANPPTPSIYTTEDRMTFPGQQSPIKDLKYPQIPRSAAVSRQAERPARRRTSSTQIAPTVPGPRRPTRDQLVRAETSFMQTDTTSSDGYLSDETIEWPIPPLSDVSSKRGTAMAQSSLKSNMAKLRNNLASGNRGLTSRFFSPSLNEVVRSDVNTVKLVVPQTSPSSKARVTPNKSSSGDLYLTVEI